MCLIRREGMLTPVPGFRFARRFLRAEEAVREAVALEPESVEARDFLRCLLGNENCRRKEMRVQVGQPPGEAVQVIISQSMKRGHNRFLNTFG